MIKLQYIIKLSKMKTDHNCAKSLNHADFDIE